MCMKNRFCRMGKATVGAFLLLSVSGLAYSCSDDYVLDDQKPSFLGGSIYDELNSRGNFKTTIKLIDDLDYKDVMSQTGSKTLFVANDEAYDAFFQNNPWGVKRYEDLTKAQKRVLFNGAQFNNAYVVEMMANADNGEKNVALRQVSAASAVDSVPFWSWDKVPVNYNEDATELKYWKRFASPEKKGLWMAVDATTPMVTHFLEGQLKDKAIKHSDIAFVLNDKNGWPEDVNRSYVYDAQITEQDVVCLNGYFHVIDKVLLPPGNMAEVIRTNGETNIFSHILDRFSAPFYNATLTDNFNSLSAVQADSVFEKRYFAVNTRTGRLVEDPNRNSQSDRPLLSFDPGWNTFRSSETEEKEKDMGAMFVPSDAAMKQYFLPGGGGRVLLERYATKPNTEENLLHNLDQIPLDVIQALVNNLMKNSFNETVPSKYLTIMNDARDPMFPLRDYPNEEAYRSLFSKTLLANNGVVYVMNKTMTPADYASVIAPALYNENATVMRTVVRADDSFIQGNAYNNAPLKQYFSTYLKAMQSRFSFFIPTDEGLDKYGYVDPAALAQTNKSRYLIYKFIPQPTTSAGLNIGIWMQGYQYDPATGSFKGKIKNGNSSQANENLDNSPNGRVKKNLLVEMVNQHIVVHGNDDTEGINTAYGRRYFISRLGAPVLVDKQGGKLMVSGGYQEQLKGSSIEQTINIVDQYDQTRETNGYGNGITYFIDRPMQPSMVSTYKAIKESNKGTKFLELCEGVNDDILAKAGFKDSLIAAGNTASLDADWAKVTVRYNIFMRGAKGGFTFNVPEGDKLVRFFNNYRYTVYLPSDAAIERELAKGLPTWASIEAFLDSNLRPAVTLADDKSNQKEYDEVKKHNDGVKAKAQAMVVTLVNFLKYHFQDESLFVDNVKEPNEREYLTSCVDENTQAYLQLKVKQTSGQLSVTDIAGNVVSIDPSMQNVLVRDANFANNNTTIGSSSFAVVHQVQQALLFEKRMKGNYADIWSSPAKAKAFVKKYNIKD